MRPDIAWFKDRSSEYPRGLALGAEHLVEHRADVFGVILFVALELLISVGVLVLSILLREVLDGRVGKERHAHAVEEVENAGGYVLAAVAITRDEYAAELAFELGLFAIEDLVMHFVEPLDDALHFRGIVVPPDWRRENKDIGLDDLLEYLRPLVAPAVLCAHIGTGAGEDRVINKFYNFCSDVLLFGFFREIFREGLRI